MAEATEISAATLAEADLVPEPRRPVFRLILLMAAILLMILPFVTTFNEFLTRVVERLHLDAVLTGWVVPGEVRLIAVLLGLLGVHAYAAPGSLILQKGGAFLPVYISWNCVGWQSFILFGITLLTGMQGPYTRLSKVETVAVGLLGTFLVNLLRITSVAAVAYFFGQLPAVLYHDYGSTVLILAWLFAYWWFSHGWLLEPAETLPVEGAEQRTLSEIFPGRA